MSYKVVEVNGKYAIVDENERMVSTDVVRVADGRYLAVKDGNMAIFDSDGNQLTEWQRAEIFTGKSVYLSEPEKREKPEIFTGDGESAYYISEPEKQESKIPTTIYVDDKKYHVRYYENLGVLEIYDREKKSISIELIYKDDIALKKGPSAPGV